jgi:hypothetical protein
MKRLIAALAATLVAGAAMAASPPPFQTYNLRLGAGGKTATATAGAATLHQPSGTITSEALTTAAGSAYQLTITDNQVAAGDIAFASVANGTNSAGVPVVTRVTPGAGSLVIFVRNVDSSAAFNGTLKISFAVLKQ